MAYASVWLNGQFVGGWPYGYSSWRLDLTPWLKPGAENVLAIRLDNPLDSSRWYPVTVTVADKEGRLVPRSKNHISFDISSQ